MSYPITRPRRLRQTSAIRDLVAQTDLLPKHLISPIFLKENLRGIAPVKSMPGVFQYSLKDAITFAKELHKSGVSGVILFGIPGKKDARGSEAWATNGLVQKAIKEIKAAVPELVVFADTCLCEYTDHGHCGLLDKAGNVRNDATLELLAKTAVSQAEAGADSVAPSDMMDGRVSAIRTALEANNLSDTLITSYAVKYASKLYGPFRDAAENTPKSGDRRGYQMDPRNRTEAIHEALLDQDEGADALIIKPASLYLDIIRDVSEATPLPLLAYQVSGEYSLIKAAASNDWIDEKGLVLESLTAMRRAGAQAIITYYALSAARWLA